MTKPITFYNRFHAGQNLTIRQKDGSFKRTLSATDPAEIATLNALPQFVVYTDYWSAKRVRNMGGNWLHLLDQMQDPISNVREYRINSLEEYKYVVSIFKAEDVLGLLQPSQTETI